MEANADLFDCIQRALSPFTNFPVVKMDRSNGCASCYQAQVLLDTDLEGYSVYVTLQEGGNLQLIPTCCTTDPREAAIEFVTAIAQQLATQAIDSNPSYKQPVTSVEVV